MTPYIRKMRAALCIAFLATALLAASAQDATSGSISGTITDTSGAAIRGATVELINTDRGQTIRTVTTNGAGFYTATALPLGTYTVQISSQGFKTARVTGVMLHVNDALTVSSPLTPGGASETVTVTAESVGINLQDATSQGLINSEQMNEMPLVTRNYATLMNLQPGVSFGGATDDLTRGPSGLTGASSTVSFSVNGGRNTANGWTIDGSDNLDRGANLTLYTYPSADAIAEFKTLRGQYSAQFGRNASGQIDVVTKSGTNSIHGSVYYYLRNDAFDANGFANNFLGSHIAPYRYNIFGFSLGGPVFIPKIYDGRNRTFFFVSEEWQRIIQYLSNASTTVPQASERAGDFTQSGYRIPSPLPGAGSWTTGPITVCTAYTTNPATQVNNCTATGTQVTNISPSAAAYIKDVWSKTPVPDVNFNIARGFDPHTIFSSFKNIFNNNDTVVRIDQQIGQKYSLLYRYMHDTFPQTLPQGQFTTVLIPGANTTTVVNPGTQHLGKGTVTFNSTMVLNAGYAYSNGNIVSTPAGFLASSVSTNFNPQLVYANTVGIIPTVTISGMQNMNGSIAYIDHGTNHQIFGDVTKIFREHTFIMGFSYNHYQKLENNTTGTQGAFGFNTGAQYLCPSGVSTPGCIPNTPVNSAAGATTAQAFANFLIGDANGTSTISGFSQLSHDPVTDIKSSLWEGFFQDNWKATRRLTLNLGVRYAYYRQPWDANLLLSNFDPSKYDPTKAPTIATTGLICFTSPCSQAGSNVGLPTTANPNANYAGVNYVNGMIFNGPNSSNNNQASQFGNKVGAAQRTNFAPRLGFAWDVFGNGRTAFRGGYGWGFDGSPVSFYETTVFNNPPAVATYSVGQTSFDSPAGGATTGIATNPGRIQALPLNFKTPYIQQYSLDVQQMITPTTMIDVGYFGDHGTHLLGGIALDQPAPGAWVGKVQPSNSGSSCIDPDTNHQGWLSTTCSRPLNQIRPYLGYNAVDALRTIFSSNYNSLQVSFTKRFKGRTYISANYTWSRDLTNGQNDYSTFPQNIYDINADYGRAALDRTDIFSLNGVYEVPWFREQRGLVGHLVGGWSLSGIFALNSGLPLTVTASQFTNTPYNLPGGTTSIFNGRTTTGYITDNAGLGVFGSTSAGARPNMLGNPNNGYGVKIHNKPLNQLWFYTGAFAATNANDPVNPGNEKRGSIEGPGFGRLDLGIHRSFRLYERLNFQFRMEAFNATNHTNVQTINTSLNGGGVFGEVAGYRDARIVQFAGRFEF